MKPIDIYNLTDYKIASDIYDLINDWHNHIPEIISDTCDYDKNTRITLRIYHDPYIDGERCNTIGAAYFDDKPVMIFRHGGRAGHDSYDEFITDKSLYKEMVAYLQSLCILQEDRNAYYDPNENIECLDTFYGYDLLINKNKFIGKL